MTKDKRGRGVRGVWEGRGRARDRIPIDTPRTTIPLLSANERMPLSG